MTATAESPERIRPAPIKAIPVRRPGQWISAAIVAALVALLVWSFATNDAIQWSVVGEFLFNPNILRGGITTIQLTVMSMVLGVVLGVVLAVMRLSHNPVLRLVSAAYLWLFRGTPVLVQIVLWFNLGLIFPRLGFGPVSADTNSLISAFGAALLALALNEAAYMAEIVRGGILSVETSRRYRRAGSPASARGAARARAASRS
jgi:polar amino acid transport system permease protein